MMENNVCGSRKVGVNKDQKFGRENNSLFMVNKTKISLIFIIGLIVLLFSVAGMYDELKFNSEGGELK